MKRVHQYVLESRKYIMSSSCLAIAIVLGSEAFWFTRCPLVILLLSGQHVAIDSLIPRMLKNASNYVRMTHVPLLPLDPWSDGISSGV